MILGLDISTSCTGASLLSKDGELLHTMAIKPAGDDMFQKANSFRIQLSQWLRQCKITKQHISAVYIEENLQGFRPGLSSAGTLLTLARFNGVASYIVFLELGIVPEYINVTTARKLVSLKIDRSRDTKEQVLEWATAKFGYTPTSRAVKTGKKKGQMVIETHHFDIADSIVIAVAGLEQRKSADVN